MTTSKRSKGRVGALVATAVAALSLAFAASASAAEPFFESTGSLITSRARAMAAPLPGGDVLVVGGTHFSSPKQREASGVASAEVYDSATDEFTPTGSMAVTRMEAAIAQLPGGKVLVAGGLQAPEASKPWASAEIYDPTTGEFTPTGSMAIGRWAPTAAPLPDGRVLVMGGGNVGYNPSTETHTATFASAEIYDPKTGEFTPTASMAVARVGAGATSLPSGKVLVAGGSWLASAELYDPETGEFGSTGSLTQAMNGPAVTLADGSALVVGGIGVGQVKLNRYDPATGTFTALSAAPERGATAIAPLPDGRVLLAGGTIGGGGSYGKISAAAQIFVPGTEAPGAPATTGNGGDANQPAGAPAGGIKSSAEEDGWEAATASHGTPSASAPRAAVLPKPRRACRSGKAIGRHHAARHGRASCAKPGKRHRS